jgi:DNA-binding transcriptional MerR regulator
MTGLEQLRHISDEPMYNAKAVKMQTGVTAATLRAWERRYGILVPKRTSGGHRWYSPRDVAAIKWLKQHIDQGMRISHASTQLQRELYMDTPTAPMETRPAARSLEAIQDDLHRALIDYDGAAADEILSEAYSLHPIEAVCIDVIEAVLVRLGHDWAAGRITVATEHFASNYLRSKLIALIDAGPVTRAGAIAIGCAPTDLHEMGVLLLSIFLRRRGWHVVYLGQAVPLHDLPAALSQIRPNVLVLASTMSESARELIGIRATLDRVDPAYRPTFGFGGPAFNDHPEMRGGVHGIFLGETIQSGIETIERLMIEQKKSSEVQ